jgi:hypothetical protein
MVNYQTMYTGTGLRNTRFTVTYYGQPIRRLISIRYRVNRKMNGP